MENPNLVVLAESPPDLDICSSETDQDWEIVDSDLRVVSSTLEGIPKWVKDQFTERTPWGKVEQLTFFYSPEIDVVVLNKTHKHADLYELLVTTYLSVGEEARRAFKNEAPMGCIETALRLLDHIIEERRKMTNA